MATSRARTATALAAVLLTATACTHPGAGAHPVPSSTLTSRGPFPPVSGGFGDKPSIRYAAAMTPSPRLQRSILRLGTGPKLVTGDLVVADYLGQVWNGGVFDNSYDHGEAAAFALGSDTVIRGWNAALVGVPVGSRVELTVPPTDGYGSAGNAAAHIRGTDTLVYVIDVAQRFDNHSTAQADASPQPVPPGLPVVSGPLTGAPTITVARWTAVPPQRRTVVLAIGHGAPLQPGTAVVRYASVTFDNAPVASSWDSGSATAIPVGTAAARAVTGALFDGLVGVPVGSRVLIVMPGAPGKAQRAQSAAVVVDLLAQVTTAKQTAGS